jgi:hypothetical protein
VSAGSKLHFLGRNIRAEQLVQNELEFEWLRQFYIQVVTYVLSRTFTIGVLYTTQLLIT